MAFAPLIDAATLHAQLERWVVVDCRFDLADPEAGRRAWAQAHIPGARYAHLDADLSGPKRAELGRHPLPDPAALAAKLGAWGIGPDTAVVAYDAATGAMAAARFWWLLRWLGHERVAVLDGGFNAWQVGGYRVDAEAPRIAPAVFAERHDDRLWLGSAEVLAGLDDPARVLIDARAAARYRGEVEPIDPVAGHIPGALNLPQDGNLGADGRFLPPEALRARFEAALGGRAPECVVHSCGSGVTACHNLLAMEAAGLAGSRLYAGSWSEWIRDPARPVARGG